MGRPLAPGQTPAVAATGLGHRVDAAGGVLTYAVAFAGAGALVSVELAVDFELVVRRIPGLGEAWRTALGSAEYDIEDLAVDMATGRVFVASRDGRVRGFDLATGAPVVTWHMGASATAVAVSPDGRYVALGSADGVVCLRRQEDGALLQCAALHTGQVSGLAVAPGGALLVSSSWRGELILWRLPSLAVVARDTVAGAACDVAFAPDGERVAVAQSAHIPVIRTPGRVPGLHPDHPRGPVPDNAVIVWTPATGAHRTMAGHRGPVVAVTWTPDGRRVISGSWDGSVRMWESERGNEIARYSGFASLVRDVAASPDSRLIAAGAWSRALQGRASVILDLLY